jgi:hypothetical protein
MAIVRARTARRANVLSATVRAAKPLPVVPLVASLRVVARHVARPKVSLSV